MWAAVLVVVVVGLLAVLWRRWPSTSSTPSRRARGSTTKPAASSIKKAVREKEQPSLADLERQMMRDVKVEAQRLMPQVEAEAARLMPQIEAEAARLTASLEAEMRLTEEPSAPPTSERSDDIDSSPPAAGTNGGPSWMEDADWAARVAIYQRQGRTFEEIAATAAYLEQRGPKVKRSRAQAEARSLETGIVTRGVYVAKEDEARYLSRGDDGRPVLRLVDSGDRLSIWSPVDGGALINPKGTGLRTLGMYASYARGSQHHASAFRAADLSKGRWVDLIREPENPHDKNAVAMCAPGSRVGFGHVQRGRAPAIARRMDAGEDLAAVSLRGPAAGRDDGTAFVLIGVRSDLGAMLEGSCSPYRARASAIRRSVATGSGAR